MKHVGLNVAADPLFVITYAGVEGALVIITADDPGMSSSQNEQDNRHYARAAGIPMLEPSDSQQVYEYFQAAIEFSERWHIPVLFSMTTSIWQAKTVVSPHSFDIPPAKIHFEMNIPERVMIPAYARSAHRRLRKKLDEIQQWNETSPLNQIIEGSSSLGIISSGVAFMHATEAAPDASFLKLAMTYPLPFEKIKQFTAGVDRCVVIEEGDPYLAESIRAEGIAVESKPEMYRFGELNVARVQRILNADVSEEIKVPPGKPPQLCKGCPHGYVFEVLNKLGCIVSGDIGCYTLGALPPYEALHVQGCMGASIGVGLGMRHTLPEEKARKVVSVIGDSTFVHSGLTGLAEMHYNPPPTGHVLIIMDNGTTAMTGMQEHPATGRTLDHHSTSKLILEDVIRAMGIERLFILDPVKEKDQLEQTLTESFAGNELTVIITRRPCLLNTKKIKEYETTLKDTGK
ncbi:MAG: thiamine pyrophosphate-binding protein, partial [Planctomycetes bacterium]|nr:thiamine pyrophosphate-binding protein [Planctomycetota bacterium]